MLSSFLSCESSNVGVVCEIPSSVFSTLKVALSSLAPMFLTVAIT